MQHCSQLSFAVSFASLQVYSLDFFVRAKLLFESSLHVHDSIDSVGDFGLQCSQCLFLRLQIKQSLHICLSLPHSFLMCDERQVSHKVRSLSSFATEAASQQWQHLEVSTTASLNNS